PAERLAKRVRIGHSTAGVARRDHDVSALARAPHLGHEVGIVRKVRVKRKDPVAACLLKSGLQRGAVSLSSFGYHADPESRGGLASAVARATVDHHNFPVEPRILEQRLETRDQDVEVFPFINDREDYGNIHRVSTSFIRIAAQRKPCRRVRRVLRRYHTAVALLSVKAFKTGPPIRAALDVGYPGFQGWGIGAIEVVAVFLLNGFRPHVILWLVLRSPLPHRSFKLGAVGAEQCVRDSSGIETFPGSSYWSYRCWRHPRARPE